MYVRLAFAVAAHLEPEILLVDEVLAVGDAAFQKKCLGKMGDVARQGRTCCSSATTSRLLPLCAREEYSSTKVGSSSLDLRDVLSTDTSRPVLQLLERWHGTIPRQPPGTTKSGCVRFG